MRESFAQGGVNELVLYGCHLGSSSDGKKLLNVMSGILSTGTNQVKAGSCNVFVRSDGTTDPNSPATVGVSKNRDTKRSDWTQTSQSVVPEPEVWSE